MRSNHQTGRTADRQKDMPSPRPDQRDELIRELRATIAQLQAELRARNGDGLPSQLSFPFALYGTDDEFFRTPPFSALSRREREVLVAYIKTRNSKEIASTLGTKLQTIQNQLASIEAKLNIHCREDLVARVLISWFQGHQVG